MQYHKVTGSNDVPLGKIRTFGKGPDENSAMNKENENNMSQGNLMEFIFKFHLKNAFLLKII